jgi:hypothetical protein
MVQRIPASMVDADLATQAELDSEVTARNTAISMAVAAVTGKLVQRVNTQTGAMSTFSALVPADDTIPQISEGTEILTVAITPQATGNILIIDAHLCVNAGAAATVIASLFADAGVNALASVMQTCPMSFCEIIRIRYVMTAASVAATTFRLRAGPSAAATVTVNGSTGARYLGGVYLSSISVDEIKP